MESGEYLIILAGIVLSLLVLDFKSVKRVALSMGITLLLIGFIKVSIYDILRVPSESMEPFIKKGDLILINKYDYFIRLPFVGSVYKTNNIKENDVVVFKKDNNFYVKRVLIESQGIKKYNKTQCLDKDDFCKLFKSVPNEDVEQINKMITKNAEGVFLLGDNRENSFDSRKFGRIAESDVIGKVDKIIANQ